MKFPKLYRIKQSLNSNKIDNLEEVVFAQLNEIELNKIISKKKGSKIGVCCGSRGINNINVIVKAVCDYIRNAGGIPFILPAMGSHGGATAEGQKKVIEKFGITEEYVNCLICSSMETIQLGETATGTPVYFDKIAFESDGIIVVNRIKPHTDFYGKNESGIVKMLSVGLGKQIGANLMHVKGLSKTITETAEVILEKAPVLGGLGIVENSIDETYIIKGVKPENFIEEDESLLKESYNQVPKLPCDNLDVLIVKEIGKEFSGTGMDSKVIGRISIFGEKEPVTPSINKIVALRLSNNSYGNALGIGLCDVTVKKLVDSIDYNTMYSNLITTTFLDRGKIPVFMETEEEAIKIALQTAGVLNKNHGKIMIIENTLHLEEVIVSESVYLEIKNSVELIEENVQIKFDKENESMLEIC